MSVAIYDFNEIKRRVTCEDYLRERGVKIVGGRCNATWRGDKSNDVSLKDGGWHDFKTEEHGTVLDLCMKVEGVSDIQDAARVLGERFHVEPKKTSHTVAVEDGTLKIETKDQPDWTGFMDLSFEERKMTVSLPEDAYRALILDTRTGDVDVPEWLTFDRVEITASTADVCCRSSVTDSVVIKTGTGDIALEGTSAGAIECGVTTGHIRMANVSCKGDVYAKVSTGKLIVNGLTCGSLKTEGSTGDVQLQNVVASGSLSIERSTGDVHFVNSDAAEIRVVTSTGDVTGTLRTAKIFTVKTSTGDVNVPASAAGGKCEIKTSTGDVRIGIASGK